MRGAEAVCAGVTTADDDHVSPRGIDGGEVQVTLLHAIGPGEILHRLVNAGQVASGNLELTPASRADREHDRVIALLQGAERDVDSDLDAGAELHALLRHLHEPAIEVGLLHLELRNAISQQATHAIVALEDGHRMTHPRQLLRGRKAGGTRAHDRDGLAR